VYTTSKRKVKNIILKKNKECPKNSKKQPTTGHLQKKKKKGKTEPRLAGTGTEGGIPAISRGKGLTETKLRQGGSKASAILRAKKTEPKHRKSSGGSVKKTKNDLLL